MTRTFARGSFSAWETACWTSKTPCVESQTVRRFPVHDRPVDFHRRVDLAGRGVRPLDDRVGGGKARRDIAARILPRVAIAVPAVVEERSIGLQRLARV
jgi:hypothetical protein